MTQPGNTRQKAPPDDLETLRRSALERLRVGGSAVVALSGGVDSAVLLSLAVEALGAARVLGVTGRSPSLAAADLAAAARIASQAGAAHETLETHEMDNPDYRANRGDRCFWCRTELFGRLVALAGERGYDQVVYGALREDLSDVRPGMRAARDFGIGAPLLEAGLTKTQIRQLAAEAGLDVTEKPASACLASRIPMGDPVSEAKLSQVERAEAGLGDLGFRQFRVRHHGEIARIEMDPEGLRRLADAEIRGQVVACVREAGFRFVVVDLEGYRAGGLSVLK